MTKQAQSFAERAACELMAVEYSAKRKTMTFTLPKAVQEEILEHLNQGSRDEDAGVQGVNFTVNLFGPHQQEFKDCCIAPGQNLRNAIYAVTWAETDLAGSRRLIRTVKAADFEQKFQPKVQQANDAIDGFMPNYKAYSEAGKRMADANFPFRVTNPKTQCKCKVSTLLAQYGCYPSEKDFRESFKVELTRPRPLAVFDISRMKNLPAGYAQDLAADMNADVIKDLERIRAEQLESCRVAMTALAGHKRLNEKTIRKAIDEARLLSDFVESFDQQQELVALADMVEDRIGKPTADFATFAENVDGREQVRRAAEAAAKRLKELQKGASAKPAIKPAVNKSAAKKPLPKKLGKTGKASGKLRPAGGLLAH